MTDGPTLDRHNLARITTVRAADAIGGEANAFTPWLAEHIEELGHSIGVELSLGETDTDLGALLKKHTEVSVGQYFLDIRAFTPDGRVAAIENQYGTSDHKHLGQILTYSAGVGADIVVWLAEDFTDPHVETLRWINKRTDDNCGVYAVRIRFIKIGDSPPAPDFEVVVAPSATARAERKANQAAEHWTKQSFLDAITNSGERDTVARILEAVEGTGTDCLWFGRKPAGQVNLHPYDLHEGPTALSQKSGRVLIRGHWTWWTATYRHDAFKPLADFLGQSVEGTASWLPLSDFDPEQFLTLTLDTSARLKDELGQ